MLARVAPGIIWVAALLASMLSLERLFKADFSDGSLEQMLLSPQPLAILGISQSVSPLILTGGATDYYCATVSGATQFRWQ